MNKYKSLLYIIIAISVILCIPSVCYLINNQTVDGFNAYYTYTLTNHTNKIIGLLSGIIIIGLLLIFSIFYIKLIKQENQIFKNPKQTIIFIMIVSFLFMIILPYLSSDIYYYIGDSWLSSKYQENPYYTAVSDLQEKGINDEILANTGVWKSTTSVYGPLWNTIARILVSFSFGKVTIALFIFKIAAYLVHILNCYIIYKITKSKKYMLLYGLNPLVLIEFLSNVHNDIYLILFILLALYFLIRKKSILGVVISLALSISIKYSTALLVPFILIYYFKDKTITKRIIYCIISGLSIVGIVVLLYWPYYRDITIFTNMLVQGTKFSQSILLLMMQKLPANIFDTINSIIIPIFIFMYGLIVIDLLFTKRITKKKLFKRYNFVMLIFIFIVLSTFQKWYVLWLLPTIIWQSKKMKRFITYLTITALIPSIGYFMVGGDPYTLGVTYSINMIMLSGVLVWIDRIQGGKNGKLSFNRWK